MKHCVVRTYRRDPCMTEDLIEKLNDGWLVKFPPAEHRDYTGATNYFEYVLEKTPNLVPIITIDGVSLYADISNKNWRKNDD